MKKRVEKVNYWKIFTFVLVVLVILYAGLKIGNERDVRESPASGVSHTLYEIDWNGCTSGAIDAKCLQTIPSGAVMFFDLASCPDGWTELTDARGRYIIGLQQGGTLKGTQGTALNNLE
jgi:hypothetical protein